jgi:hypothetical protein
LKTGKHKSDGFAFILSTGCFVAFSVGTVVWYFNGTIGESVGKISAPLLAVLSLTIAWDTAKKIGLIKPNKSAKNENKIHCRPLRNSILIMILIWIMNVYVCLFFDVSERLFITLFVLNFGCLMNLLYRTVEFIQWRRGNNNSSGCLSDDCHKDDSLLETTESMNKNTQPMIYRIEKSNKNTNDD